MRYLLDTSAFLWFMSDHSRLSVHAKLPHHHRAPFDRLLIAQSQVEGIPVITSDAAFDRYAIQRLW